MSAKETKEIDEADVFSRQIAVEGWNEEAIRSERVFIIGSGGIGNSFAMALARMGVGHITLLDMDVVDASNLNRQILFKPSQIGMTKVEALAESVREIAVRTTVSTMHCNAITHWGEVVAEAEKCTALFQGADYGGWMDYAVMSLAKALRIPFVTASTYSMQFQCDVFHGAPTQACWACNNFTEPPSEIMTILGKRAEEAGEASKPDGGGGAAQSPAEPSISEEEIVEALREAHRMEHPCLAGLVRESLRDAGVAAGPALDGYARPGESKETEGQKTEGGGAASGGGGGGAEAGAKGTEGAPGLGQKQLFGFLGALDRRTKELLVPSLIRGYDSLAFIPKDKAAATVSVGSWVGVCSIGSLMSVNVWVNMVMAGEAGVINWTSGGLRVEDSEYFRKLDRWDIAKSVMDPVVGCSLCQDARRMFDCETLEVSEAKRLAAAKAKREEEEKQKREEEEKEAAKRRKGDQARQEGEGAGASTAASEAASQPLAASEATAAQTPSAFVIGATIAAGVACVGTAFWLGRQSSKSAGAAVGPAGRL